MQKTFFLSTAQCSRRFINTFSGRLDGSTDASAMSRKAFDEIKHDSMSLLNNQQFLVSDGDEKGFIINNSYVIGPVLALPYMGFLHWKCDNVNGMTAESLFLISRILPKVEMLLLGTGQILEQPPRSVLQACKDFKIGLHIESTHQAIQTYNVLLEDQRNFAALFIPASRKLLHDTDRILLQKKAMSIKKNFLDDGL